MPLTKNEEKIWQELKDYYDTHEFSFGSGVKVPIKETKANTSFVKKLAKWLSPDREESEEFKKEYEKLLTELLKTKKGNFHISEHYLWDYLMDKQA